MPDKHADDRAWVDAVEHYVKSAPPQRRRRTAGQGRYVLASAVVLALFVSPFAVAATGDFIRAGKRTFSKRETRIISKTKTYGTRQSNTKSGDGGAAIYGCRSKLGREPCVRVDNLNSGHAFEFRTKGAEGGRINADTPGARPFTTNATGTATGLNADQVDGFSASRIDFRAAAGTPLTDILNIGGLILRASCNTGPDIDVRAATSVVNSTLHVSFVRDPSNLAVFRAANNLNPGVNFQLLGSNDDEAQGTLTYSTPAGSQVTVTFQSEEANAFGGTTACLFAGTALATS
jgi:hypothetical protein